MIVVVPRTLLDFLDFGSRGHYRRSREVVRRRDCRVAAALGDDPGEDLELFRLRARHVGAFCPGGLPTCAIRISLSTEVALGRRISANLVSEHMRIVVAVLERVEGLDEAGFQAATRERKIGLLLPRDRLIYLQINHVRASHLYLGLL